VLGVALCAVACLSTTEQDNDAVDYVKDSEWPIIVKRKSPAVCGEASKTSVRAMIESFISEEDVDWLKGIVTRGMAVFRNVGGPTITDPDLGLVMGPGGRVERIKDSFTNEELERYGKMLQRVYDKVVEVHGLAPGVLYHTAPTFIARLAPFSAGKGPSNPNE
jgi:hypothetical protein